MKSVFKLSQRTKRSLLPLLFALSAILIMVPTCWAVGISGGTVQRHERYYQGADKAFLGEQFDWSGVGRSVGSGRTPWLTMISPSYFITSKHFAPAIGEPIYFSHTNDPNGPSEQRTRASGQPLANTDTWLGKLDSPVSENVAKYPIYPFLDNRSDYQNKELYVVGRSPLSNPVQKQFDVAIGRNRVDFVSPISNFNEFSLRFSTDPNATLGFSPDEASVVTGDSGGPSFLLKDNQLGLVSTHWSISGPSIANDAFLPSHLATIRFVVESGGESLAEFILPGDFNVDGTVNAADYTVWRDGLGTVYAPADYAVWASHFGNSNSGLTVPEPSSIALMMLALAQVPYKEEKKTATKRCALVFILSFLFALSPCWE